MGTKAVLMDCSCNKWFNFNLPSLTHLLCKGWCITKGNASGITAKNGNGGIMKFDIVVRMAKGMIFACRFVRDAEIAAASTDAGTKMNIMKAHGLLGHVSEEAKRQSATSSAG